MTSLAYNFAVSLPYTEENDNALQTGTARDDWASNDITAIEYWFPPKQQRRVLDEKNATDWDDDKVNPSGSLSEGYTDVSNVYVIENDPVMDIIKDDSEQESNDRLVLLAKKYASENVTLNKEDNARLEMINQTMELKFPRYSTEDWKVIEEAKVLVNELIDVTGAEN